MVTQVGHSVPLQPEDVQMDVVDTRCGYTANCKPAFLQKFANVKSYLVIVSLCSIMQGFVVNGINNVNISSYERRYLLSSKSAGFVASCYDVSAGLTVLFVGYFGGIGHQPRYLGSGVASIALGSFVMTLAHFSAPPYEPGYESVICDIAGANSSSCSAGGGDANLKNYYYLLLLGQVFHGFGGTCLYSLGVTYLDQSVSAKMAPLYIGLMAGASVFGPAMGFIFGGFLLEIYVDYPRKPPPGLTSSDPSWVGAWWLGFLINALISLVLALFMFLFPKELPGTAEIRAAKISEAHDNGTEAAVNTPGFGMTYKDMPRAVLYLLRNAPLMLITATIAVELALAAGFSTFLPKYISNQFNQSPSFSAILTGLLAVPGAALGQMAGGWVCKKLQLKVSGVLKLTAICSGIVLVLSPIFFARCEDPNIAGLLANYPGESSNSKGLDAACNKGCGCSKDIFDPVCAAGIEYFSPCYAGCSENLVTLSNNVKVYQNCSCPAATPAGVPLHNGSVDVTVGICHVNCPLLYPAFVPVTLGIFFFTFFIGVPLTVATLRVVPEKQRAFALGLQWTFLRFLGSIPGPIITGAMIDNSCSLWEEDCGVRGSCWIYNNAQMSLRLFLLTVILKVISIVFNLIGLVVYKPPPEKCADMQDTPLANNSDARLNEQESSFHEGVRTANSAEKLNSEVESLRIQMAHTPENSIGVQ
ncbi:solute carrier organic anion transporter family member 4C1-like [Watersipora subatra]|uniref:solute carrier organic anion transporter family member 4C1-like n=1 Tax=Watersipora subatra TaxID=2589382 RepID=UPI00355AE049